MSRTHPLLAIAALLLAPTQAAAHGGGFLGSGDAAQVHQEVVKVFGDDAAFSANATLTSKRADGTRTERFRYLLRRGVLRLERTQADNPFLTPAQIDRHRAQGTDVYVTLATPDALYTIFPRLEAYFRNPRAAKPSTLTITSTEAGEETIDGHPCRKRVLRIMVEQLPPIRMTVWEAQDEQGIPIRVQDEHGEDVTILDLADFEPDPPASLFELPKGYTGYDDVQKMLAERKPK